LTKIIYFLLIISIYLYPASRNVQLNVPTQEDIIESEFKKGIENYKNGKYELAKEPFQKLITVLAMNKYQTVAHLMLAKTFYKLGDYNTSISLSNEFFIRYPNSNYIDDAHYNIANCYYRQKDYFGAVQKWFWIMENGTDRSLRIKCGELATQVVDFKLSLKDVEVLRKESYMEDVNDILTIKYAEKKSEIGKAKEAHYILQGFVSTKPNSKYISFAKDLLAKINYSPQFTKKIGVVLPLTGEEEEVGKSVLGGIQYATNKYNETTKTNKVELIIKDTESKLIKTVESIKELSNDSDVLTIVGPLGSYEAVSGISTVDCAGLPIVLPVATETGIAQMSEYVFQANADVKMRGKAIAEYAINDLKLKTFVTLSPIDDYGKQITESFVETVTNLGGTIITEEWYYPGAIDFKSQFEKIRRIGIKKVFSDSVISIPLKPKQIPYTPFQIDSLYQVRQKAFNDSLETLRKKNPKVKFDSLKIVVKNIDGFFIPLYTEDIRYLAPQFAYHNFKTKLLGGEFWFDIKELKNVTTYVNGLTFVSDYFYDDKQPIYRTFKTTYTSATGKEPTRFDIYGYDTVNFVFEALKLGADSREDMKGKLLNVSYYGIRGGYSFSRDSKVNSFLNILQFINGEVIKLK
jgi:ABC-type branched-subunit amino acid transport system substrate-binding protein